MQTYWASQSPVTDPGPAAAAIDALPGDPALLRAASSQLVFHFQTGGDFAEYGVPAGRMAEINTRYADAMLALLLDSGWTAEVNGRPVDWRDLAGDQFGTGPRAWQAARAGTSDPDHHGHPDADLPVLRGWPILADHVVHDLAALNKTEMLLWDGWGLLVTPGWMTPGPVPEPDAALLDEVCAATADPAVSPDVIAALGAHDGLRVPETVTRFDPNGAPPQQVDVTRVLAARGHESFRGQVGGHPVAGVDPAIK